MTLMTRLVDVWWGTVPAALARVSRVMGILSFDGAWLVGRPAAAALLPPLALGIGFFVGWLHPPDGAYTFTASVLTVGILLVTSAWGGGVGLWCLVGYAIGDFLLFPHAQVPPLDLRCEVSQAIGETSCEGLEGFLNIGVPSLISYLALAQLLVVSPVAAATLRSGIMSVVSGRFSAPIRLGAGVQAIAFGLLVFLWTTAIPFMIRPLTTWLGDQPPVAAVLPMQSQGWILALLAVGLGAVRGALEAATMRRPGVVDRLLALATRVAVAGERPRPSWIGPVIGSLLATALVAGIFVQPLHAAGFLAAALSIAGLRRWLGASPWASVVGRVPILLRLALAAGATYWVALLIFGTRAFSTGFETVIMALVGALLIGAILVPEPGSRATTAGTVAEPRGR